MTTQKRLVAQAGIEPTAQAYETRMLPLHYRAASPTVGTIGVEPIQAVLQTAALPLELYSRIIFIKYLDTINYHFELGLFRLYFPIFSLDSAAI